MHPLVYDSANCFTLERNPKAWEHLVASLPVIQVSTSWAHGSTLDMAVHNACVCVYFYLCTIVCGNARVCVYIYVVSVPAIKMYDMCVHMSE